MPSLEPSQFPQRPALEGEKVWRFELPAADLYRLLSRTAFASSDEATPRSRADQDARASGFDAELDDEIPF